MLRRWVPMWVVPLVIVLAIGTVWLRLSIVGTTYTISQADRKIRELQHGKQQMELKVTALRSPRRLEILAKTRFGLSQPKSEQIIHLKHEVSQDKNPQKDVIEISSARSEHVSR